MRFSKARIRSSSNGCIRVRETVSPLPSSGGTRVDTLLELRICPGRHLAMDSLWLSMARILASFDLAKEVDERGAEIEPVVRFSSGLTSHPEPFGCRFTPRSPDAITIDNHGL
jgi:hypothetical protein